MIGDAMDAISSRPDYDNIREALQSFFPDLERSGWRVLGWGFGATVLEHVPGGVIISVARSNVSGRRMARVLPVLEWLAPRLRVAVPAPFWSNVPDKSALLPSGAFAYRKLTGETLSPETVAYDTVEGLVWVLAELHTLPTGRVAAIPGLDPEAFRRERYAAIRDVLKARLDAGSFARVEAWQAAPVPRPDRLTIVHGDFWHENILIDPETREVTGVLDWEGVTVGDPAQDLVTLRYLGDGIAAEVLERYLRLVPEARTALEPRLRWWRENRDFDGIYLAQAMNDAEELDDSIRKLQRGPVLNP
jgi:aminoglycoside phosphotransferase (APT) family kinase protein